MEMKYGILTRADRMCNKYDDLFLKNENLSYRYNICFYLVIILLVIILSFCVCHLYFSIFLKFFDFYPHQQF